MNKPLLISVGPLFVCGLVGCSDPGSQDGIVLETYEGGEKKARGARLPNGDKTGHWVSWHKNGKKKLEGVYQDGAREGIWTGWYENGQMSGTGLYEKGKQEGVWTAWYWSGAKATEGRYAGGRKEGAWRTYKEDGSVEERLSGVYKMGEKISGLPDK